MAVLDLLPDKILTTDLQYYLQKHRIQHNVGSLDVMIFHCIPFLVAAFAVITDVL
jgi:hypothetical protein